MYVGVRAYKEALAVDLEGLAKQLKATYTAPPASTSSPNTINIVNGICKFDF